MRVVARESKPKRVKWKACWGACRFAGLVFGVLWPAVAAERPATFRLSWVRGPGTEECPSAQQLGAAVSARLGRDPFSNEAAQDIEGSVSRVHDDWQAHLSVLGPEGAVLGSRELEAHGADCSSLADAVTLAVVLTIDPDASLDAPARRPSETSRPNNEAAPATVAPSPIPVPPATLRTNPNQEAPQQASRPEQRGMAIASRAVVQSGILPAVSFGAELGAELPLTSALRLSVALSYLPEVRTADRRFGFGISAGGFGICYAPLERAGTMLALCGEVEAGAIHVVVYDPVPTKPGEHFWLSGRFGPRLALQIVRPVELELGAYAVFPVIRDQFAITGVGEPVFQTSPVSLLASAGLSLSIP